MLRDEPIRTKEVDLLTLKRGERYELDEQNAISLLGRGYAILIVKNGKKETLDRAELEKMTVADLRKLADEHGVQDVKLLRKTDLIDALCPEPEEKKPA
jgi:hypothetical protein